MTPLPVFPALEDGDFETVRIKRDGKLLHVTLDHPPVNAVDDTLHTDLTRLFARLRHESDARAIVLTGQGRVFCAGGDFHWFPQLRGAEQLDRLRRHATRLIWDLLDIEIPIVAAVNGPAAGLGATLALLCDVIFMAESATIADPHVCMGVVAGDGGTAIWPLAVGPARAKEYLLTGDPLTAVEAERIGLVNHVTPDDELHDRATAFAGRLADGAPLALRATKLCVNNWVKEALRSTFDTACALELVTFESDDHEEAVAAFREQRPPLFHGR
jgi:enoyl-CoA hydratase